MRITHYLALAAILLCISTLPIHGQTKATEQETKPVKISFWNIQWFPGGRPKAPEKDQKVQIDLVGPEIAKLAPDVLGMEEVRDWKAAELAIAKLPGFKIDVCSNFIQDDRPGTQQIAIASRLPALGAWAEPFKAVESASPPRGFAFAAYELAPKRVLLVYAVHFKSNRGELAENIALREESMRQLLDHQKAMVAVYGKMGEVTTVIGGDFNTSLDDPRFAEDTTIKLALDSGFEWCWKDIPFEKRITIPASHGFPDGGFDHILYKGAKLASASTVTVPMEASDHRPVTAVLNVKTEKPE